MTVQDVDPSSPSPKKPTLEQYKMLQRSHKFSNQKLVDNKMQVIEERSDRSDGDSDSSVDMSNYTDQQ